MFHILLAEDDANLRSALSKSLRNAGYTVVAAEDGRIAYDSFCEERFDLVITDVMMPRMDGNELTSELRKISSDIPILMLTALEALDDKEKGFNAGADDYLVKPFALKELVLRVKALLRRYGAVSENKIILPHTELNYNTNTAIIGGQQIELTKKEFQLLFALLGAIVCIVMAVTLIGSILAMVLDEQLMMSAMYISQLIIITLITFAFHYIVNRMIVRRISRLNDAMSRVAEGDYEISVPVEGNDELSRLTESFDSMTNELKMNAFLSKDFARYVSHECKTPLAVIRSYAEMTQDEACRPDTVGNMDVIISEADRLTSLSKDILELCRLDSTTIIEKKDTFSPASQIRSILLDLQLIWGEKNIDIIPELDEFKIISNEALLYRVWQNIIGNAIKFTGKDGSIAVSLKKTSAGLVFRVRDTGGGISEEEKAHIFTPFYSGGRQHNKEGSGLGLSLCKKIIDKLGGTITFDSVPGVGTEFVVGVPYDFT